MSLRRDNQPDARNMLRSCLQKGRRRYKDRQGARPVLKEKDPGGLHGSPWTKPLKSTLQPVIWPPLSLRWQTHFLFLPPTSLSLIFLDMIKDKMINEHPKVSIKKLIRTQIFALAQTPGPDLAFVSLRALQSRRARAGRYPQTRLLPSSGIRKLD